MAQYGSPSIVRNGLVFYYDTVNPKSFKGQPATNLVTNAATMANYNNYSNGPVSTFMTEFGTVGWRMTSAGSWNGCYQGVSIPSTGTYTFSAWYRYWGGSGNNNGATCYVSGWGGGDSASSIDKTKIGVWQRISITLNVTTSSVTFYLISYGGTNNADNSTWEVTMPQVESGSYPTPFVNGTRSNTQAIVDMTNNYTITANSLTYASDNTFSFNGSTNYMETANNIINGNNTFTFESFYTISGAGSAEIFGNYGSGYSSSSYIWISGQYGLYIGGAVYFPGAPLGVGTYHMACTRDGNGNCVLYKNGIQVNSGTLTGSITAGPNFRIGIDTGGAGEPLNGKIYSQKLYNRVLTAAEISQNFNAHRKRYGI
jgi:hypothetical protein